MHDSKQHDEVATGFLEYPAVLRSFLETSAHYFGLDGVPPDLLCQHDFTTPVAGAKWYENQNLEKRDAA